MQFVGVIAFIIALLLSVMIHEFGHFITARRYGMKVTEFFLGFGKRLWSTTRGETEFGIKLIPAGGYCRIEGMSASDDPDNDPRAFHRANSGRKLIVLGAGSFLHFVLGYLLLFILFLAVGTSQLTSTISEVSACIPSSASNFTCTKASPISPAKSAGLRAGDKIVSINAVPIKDWMKDVQVIRDSPGRALSFGVERGSKVLELSITPAPRKVNGKTYGFIGIINEFAQVRSSPLNSLSKSATTTWSFGKASVKSLLSLPSKIPELWSQTVGGKKRDPEGLVGVVGVARVSGQAIASHSLSTAERVGTFIMIIASLNIFVGIFNVLPILPLDGGHMAVAIADEIRAFYARLRGRARPAPIDVAVLTPITMVVFLLLAGLTLLLLVADIVNPVTLNL